MSFEDNVNSIMDTARAEVACLRAEVERLARERQNAEFALSEQTEAAAKEIERLTRERDIALDGREAQRFMREGAERERDEARDRERKNEEYAAHYKIERDRLAAALRLCLDYMGRPPTNSMSFDSEWEDAWKAARAALREVDGP